MTFYFLLMLLSNPVDRFDIALAPTVDQTVWDIGEDVEQQIHDAVVLEDLYHFQKEKTLRYRKIRIFSENGKAAADFVDFSGKATNLQGRTVQRDGTVVPFSNTTDFVEVLAYKKKSDTRKSKVLIPPGLTDDCVVELRWETPGLYGIPKGKSYNRLYVQEGFFCKEVTFYYKLVPDRDYHAAPFPTLETEGRETTYHINRATYRNVPASMDHPFSLPSGQACAAHFLIFPKKDGNKLNIYEVYTGYYMTQMFSNRLNKNGKYKKWIKTLKKNMRTKADGTRADDAEAVAYLLREFHKRIVSTALLNPDKKVGITRELSNTELKSRIKEIFRLGYGQPFDLAHLFANVVRDCSIQADLLLPQTNDSPKFEKKLRNFFDVETHLPLVGVETESGYAAFMPEYPELEPGIIPPSMEGQTAVAMSIQKEEMDSGSRTYADIKFGQGYRLVTLPKFNATQHQIIRTWNTHFNEVGGRRLEMEEKSTGIYSASTKRTFSVLPQQERDAHLFEYWERRLSDWKIETTRVEKAETVNAQITEHVTAVHPGDGTSNIYWLDPFPGSGMPIKSPKYWPPNRTEDIFLGNARTVIDRGTIALPMGYKLKGDPSFTYQNSVGQVTYNLTEEADEVRVERQIIIQRNHLPARYESELRQFIARVEEAYALNLAVVKTAPMEVGAPAPTQSYGGK